MSYLLSFTVNGVPRKLELDDPRLTLLDCLRERLDLTGAKKGCDRGQCGACTVLVDGRRIYACLALAVSLDGADVTTVEGVSEGGGLAALQKAYGDFGGSQCGYCTPGFMMTVRWLLANNPDPSEEEIREALSSNLCRCTGYSQMYQAIRAVIEAEQRGMKRELAGAKQK